MNKNVFSVLALIVTTSFNLVKADVSWYQVENPLGVGDSNSLGKVQFVSSDEAWISGSLGTLFHSTDAGESWTMIEPFPEDTLWSVSDPAWSMSWIGTTHGWKLNNIGTTFGQSRGVVLHRTTNGGGSWEKITLPLLEGDAGIKVQFVDQLTGYVLTFSFSTGIAQFLKTTDGGDHWSPFNGAGIFFFINADEGWSFSSAGPEGSEPPHIIYHTTNGGVDWTVQMSDSSEGGFTDIFFYDANHGWVVGDQGKVFRTVDGGVQWDRLTNSGINPNRQSKTVFFLDETTGWIPSKTDEGEPYIQHTSDGGSFWTTQTIPLGNMGANAIFSICFNSEQTGILTADNGRICRYVGTTGGTAEDYVPDGFSLKQNFPNPFNPDTEIQYTIPTESHVSVTIYDIKGRLVEQLVDRRMPAGSYSIIWHARGLNAGIYFYRLRVDNHEQVNKCMLIN